MSKRKRIQKIMIASLVLVCTLFSLFYTLNLPFLTPHMAFRRMEKRNLIGPAEIIATVDFEHGPYDHIFIGESEYGYTFFEWRDSRDWDSATLNYVTKKEGVTLYCTYRMYGSEDWSADWLPIFAFADNIAADSAKLTLTTTQEGETVTYPLLAQRSEEGYFLFSWKTLDLRAKDFWLVQQHITGEYSYYILDGTATATIEFFDRNGDLLETHPYTR